MKKQRRWVLSVILVIAALSLAYVAAPRRRIVANRRRLVDRTMRAYVARCKPGRVEQRFTLTREGQIVHVGGLCLSSNDAARTDGTQLFLADCAADETRTLFEQKAATRQLVSSRSGAHGPLCLDVCMSAECMRATVDVVVIWDCRSAGFNQKWWVVDAADGHGGSIQWKTHTGALCLDISAGDLQEEEQQAAGVVGALPPAAKEAPALAAPDAAELVAEDDRLQREVNAQQRDMAAAAARPTATAADLEKRATLLSTAPVAHSTRSKDHRCWSGIPGEREEKSRPENAIVTVLITPAQCDTYGEGAEVLSYTVRKYVARDDFELVAMLWAGAFLPGEAATDACIASLRAAGYRACVMNPITPPHLSKFHRFADLYVKLAVFNLVEYKKVALVDSDVAVLAPGWGRIFDTPLNASFPFAAVRDYWTKKGGWQPSFNTGVFVVQPSVEGFEEVRCSFLLFASILLFAHLFFCLFEEMMRVCMKKKDGLQYNTQMSEQGWLYAYFRDRWIELDWHLGANLDMLSAGSAMRDELIAHPERIQAVHYTACKPFCGPTAPGAEACAKKPRCYAWGYKLPLDEWWFLRAEAAAAGEITHP